MVLRIVLATAHISSGSASTQRKRLKKITQVYSAKLSSLKMATMSLETNFFSCTSVFNGCFFTPYATVLVLDQKCVILS